MTPTSLAVFLKLEADIDVAIRIGALPDSLLMTKRLAPHRCIVCASPDHLARKGRPSVPRNLDGGFASRCKPTTNDYS